MGRDAGVWVVALVAAGAAVFALLMGGDTPDPVGRGTLAPDFTLARLSDGKPVRLADLRGHVVLLNFWATWCSPCTVEMPSIQELYSDYKEEIIFTSVFEASKKII